MLTTTAIILFAMKLISDTALGWRALKKVDKLTETVAAGFENHERRITGLEDREVSWKAY